MNTVQTIRDKFALMLERGEFAEDGNLEIVNANFVADEASIFGTVNDDWNQRELQWYMSQSRNVNDIPEPIPQIWKQVATKDGQINSNYGWCVFSMENGDQFTHAIYSLVKNPSSRQALMIYTRPTMHEDATYDGMKDFMCTNTVQMLIRKNKLEYIVNMRSNDALFGYKGDFHWQYTMQRHALSILRMYYPELELGNLYWNAGSLHIYPRHFHLVQP